LAYLIFAALAAEVRVVAAKSHYADKGPRADWGTPIHRLHIQALAAPGILKTVDGTKDLEALRRDANGTVTEWETSYNVLVIGSGFGSFFSKDS